MRSSDVCCIFYVFILQWLLALILVVVKQLFHFMVGMNVRSECIWHHETLLVQLALTFTIKSCNFPFKAITTWVGRWFLKKNCNIMGFHFQTTIVFTIYHNMQACQCASMHVCVLAGLCTMYIVSNWISMSCRLCMDTSGSSDSVVSKCTFQNPSRIFSLALGSMMQHIIVVFLLFYIFQSKFTQSAKRIAP